MTVGVANQRQHILSLLNYLGIWFSASGQVTQGARARAEPEAVGPEGVGSLAGPRGAPIKHKPDPRIAHFERRLSLPTTGPRVPA